MNSSVNRGRSMLLVCHTGWADAIRAAREVLRFLTGAGIEVRVLDSEAASIDSPDAIPVPAKPQSAVGVEMVIVLGGDGTLLRAADLAREAGAPVLGVNLGHVGFLAEAEPEDLAATVRRVV